YSGKNTKKGIITQKKNATVNLQWRFFFYMLMILR
ncbi:MAG: hypothetical protein ACI8YQ_004399, partial [Polaribacter sp.]